MKASFDYVTIRWFYCGSIYGYVIPFGAIEALVAWHVPCCGNLGYADDNETLYIHHSHFDLESALYYANFICIR